MARSKIALRNLGPIVLALTGCGGSVANSDGAPGSDATSDTVAPADVSTDAGSVLDASSDASANTCLLTANTTATTNVNSGCALLTRDTSACLAARTAAGLSGAWLQFSCRVTLAMTTDSTGASVVQVNTDSQPDYKSNYFVSTDPCYEAYTTQFPDPNLIAAENVVMKVPVTPAGLGRPMAGLGAVGIAINGVMIFSNTAAPGDDIYTEAYSFDHCQGHPNRTGYHYHSEPYAISHDDAALVGVMRDGAFIYGRKDADGSTPTLDANGGHTGTTPDSATPVYHYHVNEQTSTNTMTAGQTAWFLTTGTFASSPGACTGCGDMP